VAETENKDPNNRSLKLKYTFVYDATEVRWRRILPW
jgi:hypothetical protein